MSKSINEKIDTMTVESGCGQQDLRGVLRGDTDRAKRHANALLAPAGVSP
jgi:hypothetical protein